MTGTNILNLIEQGGIVIYPLILCSIVSVAVVIERGWSLITAARGARRLHQLVEESLKEDALADAVAACRRDRSPLAPVYRTLLANTGNTVDARDRLAGRQLTETTRQLKRFVWLLGTIGSLAPFIGLFGTVVGIIRAFENMAATGSGGFAVVAAGISEALVATAGGILVGVLSIFAYNAYLVRINAIAAEFRERTEDVLALIAEPPAPEGAHARVAQSR